MGGGSQQRGGRVVAMEVPLGGLLRVYLRSTSVREGLSQRQVETNLEPWGVTYKILLLLLFVMCKKKKGKESKRTDALKVAKETRAIRGSFEGSAGSWVWVPCRASPTGTGMGWASEFEPRLPRCPARATGAWLGTGTSLHYSLLSFSFSKKKASKGREIWARTPSLFGFVQGFLFIYLFTFIDFVSVISSRHDPRVRRHAGRIAATERATTGQGGLAAGAPGRAGHGLEGQAWGLELPPLI